jgi:hypothetical protein
VQSELAAIGNKILSFKRSNGVLHTEGLKLDIPEELPPPLPMEISKEQIDKLAGYGSRTFAPSPDVKK